MSAAQKIYVECNPLLDISAHVDADFLKTYGLEPAAAALCTPEQMPIYEALEKKSDVSFIPGGSGLNTARVAKWMMQKPDAEVTYVGSIADDKYGALLKSAAEKEGLNMAVAYSTTNPTGSCAVCIVGKERSLLANLAAANDLKVEHLDTAPVQKAITEASIYYFTGFTLTISKDHVLKVAEHSAKNNGTFSMNLSAPFIIDFFPLMDVMPYVDIVFSNDDEAKAMAKKQGWETEDIKEIAQKVAALPKVGPKPRLVVFTQGSNFTIAATTESVQTVDVPKIEADAIVDTNGAGDSFVGGFLAAMALSKSVEDCCKAGHYAAGVIIQNDGCTFPAKPTHVI
jgi:adenosine kinase